MTGATTKSKTNCLAIFALQAALIGPVLAQSNGGSNQSPDCPVPVDNIALVANIFDDPTSNLDSPLVQIVEIGDIDNDGVNDLAVIDYQPPGHTLVVASGATGAIWYSITGVDRPDYWFAVEVEGVGDANNNGVPDVMIASYTRVGDGFLADFLLIDGQNGSQIVRMDINGETTSCVFFNVYAPEDVDKTGDVTTGDVSRSVSNASQPTGMQESESDTNSDGTVDVSDVVRVIEEVGNPPSFDLVQIAIAIDGSVEGDLVFVCNTRGLFGRFKKVIDCIACGFTCGTKWDAASHCMEGYRDAAQLCEDTWPAPTSFEEICDYAQCLDNARLNFLPDCLQAVADTAGDCGSCITTCHPAFLADPK